jgi:D-alanyl-D-alanine carboxypeptidase
MRTARIILCAALLAVAAAYWSGDGRAAFSPRQKAGIARLVRSTMLGSYHPGMVVGIWAPGRGTYVRAFGTANAARGRRLRVTDRFKIGSITKTFTASIVLQLAQEGKLSLDDPLSKWKPSIRSAAGITVRQLLNHTSGLPNYAPSLDRQVRRNPFRRLTHAQIIDPALRQPYTPNGIFNYSNINYFLLGEIAQMVTKKPLATLLRRRIFRRFRLRHTAFVPGSVLPSPFAHGYQFPGGHRIDVTRWPTWYGWAAGSIVSTLGDLKRWARIVATGRGLLSPAMQQQRLTFVPTGATGIGYGLGIFQYGAFLGHDGAVYGYDSTMLYSPTLRSTFVLLGTSEPDNGAPVWSQGVTTLALFPELVAAVYPNLEKPSHVHHVARGVRTR